MEFLHCNKRIKNTTHDAKKERRKGLIPGVLYGKHMGSLMFEIAELELNKEIFANGEHGILNLDVDGESHKGLIKEIQRDPVSHKIIHIDIEDLSGDKLITTEVPVVFSGEEVVVRNGCILQKEKSSVKIQCKAENLPKYLNVNISNSKIGDTYRIKDVEFAGEISFLDDINAVLAAITDVNTNDNAESLTGTEE